MREADAWRVTAFGAPKEALELVAAPPAALGDDEVRVAVRANGLNQLDVGMCLGTHPLRPEPPFVLGAELVGVVTEVGARVERLRHGERVVAMSPLAHGAFRRDAVVPEYAAHPISDRVHDADASALLVTYQAAYVALKRRARLTPGEWVLVTGAAGALGTALIQVARALGGRVVAAASSEDKRRVCLELGAEAVVDGGHGQLARLVRDATGGHGVDVACDLIGGERFDAVLDAAAIEARVVTMGWVGGSLPRLDPMRLIVDNLTVLGLSWGTTYPRQAPDVVRETHTQIMTLYDEGKIKPLVGAVVPHSALPQALDAIRDRAVNGKSVLIWGDDS
jgi:NADPH2:quinone reductase